MKKVLFSVLASCLMIYTSVSLANSSAVSLQLEDIVKTHITATSKESESIEAIMKTIHVDSPLSIHIKMQMEQMFPLADVNASLVEFSYVGLSGEYAIARFKQKLEKISGPAQLKTNVNENVVVFKQEQGDWKIWQMTMLDMDFL